MTLPPEKLGDQGQRYEIQTKGWPKDIDTWQVVGWAVSHAAASRMRRGIKSHPCVTRARIIDRELTP